MSSRDSRYVFLIVLCLWGCETVKTNTINESDRPSNQEWTPVSPVHNTAPALVPTKQLLGRHTRRLTVDHLRRAIPDLFGGETWRLRRGGTDYSLIDSLSSTLGEADYNEITTSLTAPSPLFQKFMDDMAGQMCSKAVQSDLQTATETHRLVLRFPDDLDSNLRFLRLKFHGIHVPEDADPTTDGLDDLRRLFSDIASSEDEQSAWIGVCMAMVTAPEFLAY
jgi:hypothetical protein